MLLRLKPLLLLACALVAASGARAQTMYLQDNPPYSGPGTPPGIMLQVVREMARLLHVEVPVQFMDWPVAQKTVREGKDGIIFPFTRTPQRETQYAWLLKFWDVEDKFVVAEGKPAIDSYEAAAALPGVGVIEGSAEDTQLKDHKLTNLHRYANAKAVAAAVAAGQVAAGYGPLIEVKYAWLQQKLPGTPVFGKTVFVGAHWIATSKNAPDINPADWQQAFDALQQDGTFDRIYASYFGAK